VFFNIDVVLSIISLKLDFLYFTAEQFLKIPLL